MQSAETLANLQKFLTLLNPSLSLDEMLTNVARQLVEMFEVEHSGVLFFGNEDVEGVVLAEYPAQGAAGLRVPLTEYPLLERLKTEQQPVTVLDAQHDALMGPARATMRLLGIKSILIVPLIVQAKIVGSFSLDAIRAPRAFTKAEIDLCAIIGKQIAVAIDYTRALEAAEASRRQAQTLREVNRVLGESLNLDEILPRILDQLEKVVPVDASSIFLLVDGGLQLVATRGLFSLLRLQEIVPVDRLWGAQEIIQNRVPLIVGDVTAEPHWRAYPGSSLRSWLGVPLVVRGEAVGVLNMDGYTPHQFTPAHISLAQAFANHAAMAITNARLYGQAEKRADMLASVQEIGLSMVASLDLQEVLREIATSVLSLLEEAGHVRIYLYDPEEESFTLAAILDDAGRVKIRTSLPRKTGLTSAVARSGRYMAIPDTREHPFYAEDATAHGFLAIIGVPLEKRDRVLGVLNVFYPQPHQFSDDEINLLHLLATQAAVALENARLYSQEQARLQDEARRVERLRRVQEITSSLNASLELESVLHNACEQFVRLMEVDHCGIVLLDNDAAGLTGRVVAEYPPTGTIDRPIPLDYPAARQFLSHGLPFASTNTGDDPLLGEAGPSLQALGVQSILFVPLAVQGQVIGSIGFDAIERPRHFTEEEINMSRIVADQMAIAITNARVYQAERTARVQADTLREVAAILNGTLKLDQVLERILAQLERVITYDSSSIILREGDFFRLVATRGFPEQVDVAGLAFRFADRPHFREISRTRQPLLISDTYLYPGWRRDGPTPIRSWIGAPLSVSDQLVGLLSVDHLQPDFYQPGEEKLVTAFADLAAIALENARLYEFEVRQVEQELYIARQIQQGLFPKELPRIPGWDIAASCLPARETGGDFYEFVKRADGRVGLAVGDVSGKSLPAAMLMADARSVVRAKGSDYASPAQVLAETNALLCDDVPKATFIALSYALVTPDCPTVSFSNGGQLAPYLVPADDRPVQLVETPGNHLPLGILSNSDYHETVINLEPGDLLVFHTDGIIERRNHRGELFGFERLARALAELRGQPPEEVLVALLWAVEEFGGDQGQADDVTLVVVQRQG